MALFKKAELAAECGITKAYISMALKRGKLIDTADGEIDSNNPVNAAFIAQQKERKSAGKTAKMPEKPGKTPKKKPSKKQTEISESEPVAKVVSEKFEVDIGEKRARTAKIQQEMRLAAMKEMKLTGQLIPTDLVSNTIRQLMQAVMVSFNDASDALIVDVAKRLKIDRAQLADLRSRLKHITNEAVDRSVSEAQKNIQNIVQEHSQAKNLTSNQTLFG